MLKGMAIPEVVGLVSLLSFCSSNNALEFVIMMDGWMDEVRIGMIKFGSVNASLYFRTVCVCV